jgi:hypothetical protein
MALRRAGKGITHLMKRISLISIFFFILFLFLASTTIAQVQVRVRVIQASTVGSTIDSHLKDVHDQLGSLFNFTSYRLLRDETLTLSTDQPVSVPVHTGRSMEINLVGQHRDIVKLIVKIKREGTDVLNTHVRLSPRRTILIGGPKHGEGVLILALSTRL